MNEPLLGKEAQPSITSHVLALWGVKGGVGTTHVALSLFLLISWATQYRPLLVDLDLQMGVLGHMLGIEPGELKATVLDLLPLANELNRTIMESALVPVSQSARFLPPPRFPEESELVDPGDLEAIISHAGNWFDPVILDVPSGFSSVALPAIDGADLLLLVSDFEIHSLRNAEKIVLALERMGFDAARTFLVLNGYRSRRNRLVEQDIESILGIRVLGSLPWDGRVTFPLDRQGPRVEASLRGRYWRAISVLFERTVRASDRRVTGSASDFRGRYWEAHEPRGSGTGVGSGVNGEDR